MSNHVGIAVIAPIQPEDFLDLLWQGVWEATFELGSFGVEVQNLTTERADVGAQRELLGALLEHRVDAIAILPAHPTELNDLIDEHEARGTPVVTLHGDMPNSRRSAFVGPDHRRAGALAGEVLVKLMGGRGRIVAIPGSGEKFYLAQRYRGFQEELARLRAGDPDALPLVECREPELLEAAGPAEGYYIGGPQVAEVGAMLEKLKVRAPCVGFSNTERARAYLERGTVSALIDQGRYLQGYFAVQKAYEAVLKRQEHSPLAGVRIPSTMVFSANAPELEDRVNNAFEMLVRQRTDILLSYKERLEQANTQLTNLSVTDPLTGLHNRRKFEEALEQETARALRYGPVSLLMIDLNRFKLVNDRYGHQAGDEALKLVARVLKKCCRTTDTCARLGGDEFAVILPHSNPAAARIVRDRILHQIAKAVVPVEGEDLSISLSIGQATLPGDADDSAALIAAADTAMYQAKTAFHAVRAKPSELGLPG